MLSLEANPNLAIPGPLLFRFLVDVVAKVLAEEWVLDFYTLTIGPLCLYDSGRP